jgi:predicted membrane metal-binding protein
VIPGSSAAQTTLTLSTLKGSATTAYTASAAHHAALAFWLAFPGMLILLPLQRRRALAGAFLILLTLSMISCGGGGSSTSTSGAAVVSGTQPGTYQITVVGDAGGLTHSSQISLIVQ